MNLRVFYSAAGLLVAGLLAATLKFGAGFLAQFFISPFQFFIVVPWVFAFYALRTGNMPTRSGGKLERAKDPVSYRIAVWFCLSSGAVMFAFNLLVSWLVMSRPR